MDVTKIRYLIKRSMKKLLPEKITLNNGDSCNLTDEYAIKSYESPVQNKWFDKLAEGSPLVFGRGFKIVELEFQTDISNTFINVFFTPKYRQISYTHKNRADWKHLSVWCVENNALLKLLDVPEVNTNELVITDIETIFNKIIQVSIDKNHNYLVSQGIQLTQENKYNGIGLGRYIKGKWLH